MSEALSFVGTLTIASSGIDSNVLSNNLLQSARRLIFRTPSAFTGTVTIKGSPLKGALMAALLPIAGTAGTPITLTAGREQHVEVGNLKSLAVTSGSAEAAERVITVHAVHEV